MSRPKAVDTSYVLDEMFIPGKMFLEEDKLIFISSNEKINLEITYIEHICAFPEKSSLKSNQRQYVLNIVTKALKRFDFYFSYMSDCQEFIKTLTKYFHNSKKSGESDSSKNISLKSFYDINDESIWRVSSLNNNYGFCRFLPECVPVCSHILDEDILNSLNCHVENRFPILSYIFPSNKSCIFHSSNLIVNSNTNQPIRSTSDEDMLTQLAQILNPKIVCIIQIYHSNTSVSKKEKETSIAASGTNLLTTWQVFTKFNTKSINLLPIKFLSLCLGHILVSLGVVPAKYYLNNQSYNITPENSTSIWLNNMFLCLSHAYKMAKHMSVDTSVYYLLEETGTDYVLILSSLCQILLDHSVRSIEGFLNLIYREWIVNGHPFDTRHKYILPDTTNASYQNGLSKNKDAPAPVFFFFLNCVKIIIDEHSRCFEFNENFLMYLFETSYEYMFGNNEKSRYDSNIDIGLLPLWNNENPHFKNDLYLPYEKPLIHNPFMPHQLKLWDTVFLQRAQNHSAPSHSQMKIDLIRKLILLKE